MYVTFSGYTNSCEDMSRGYDDPMATVLGKDPCDELEYLGAIWKFDESKSNQRLIDGYPRRVLDVPIPLDQSLLASYGPNNLAEGQPISVTNLGSKQPESEKDNALNLD